MRVGAIDCGTNSIRLLVADVDGDALVEVDRASTIVRLGQGIDATGQIAPEALARTFAALDTYAATIREHGCERVRFVATSAARDASNRDDFEAGVQARIGVRPDIVPGPEEAELSYTGAARGILGLPDVHEPVVVMDIGGGSTELVRGEPSGTVRGQSLDIGSVRLTERYLHSDPPTETERAAATAEIDGQLDLLVDSLDDVHTLVGVAGSATTVTALAVDAQTYDRQGLHQTRVPRGEVLAAAYDLVGRTVAQRMALPFMQEGRADVIGAGALILARVVERAGVDEMILSKSAILEGIALALGRS